MSNLDVYKENIRRGGCSVFPHNFMINGVNEVFEGMTLRDYFAGQALSVFGRDELGANSARSTAEWCYSFADLMIDARK